MTISELIQTLNNYGIHSISYDNYEIITKKLILCTLEEAYYDCNREEFSCSDYMFLCDLVDHCIDIE